MSDVIYISQVPRMAQKAIDGTASTDEIQKLLQYYYSENEHPKELTEFVTQAFKKFCEEGISLDKAFGIIGGGGRPLKNVDDDREIARFVLDERLAGRLASVAIDRATHKFNISRTVVMDAWRKSKEFSKDWFLVEQYLVGEVVSDKTYKDLKRILRINPLVRKTMGALPD